MTITPLHQLTFTFDTFHTSQMTVTLSVKWCTSSSPFTSPHDHHTSPPTDTTPVTLPDNCHTFHTSLHLPHNHHTSPSTVSLLLGLSHFLSSVTPSWWQSCIPYYVPQLSHFTNSFHPSQMALTLSSHPSHYMYIFPLPWQPHSSLTTLTLPPVTFTPPKP